MEGCVTKWKSNAKKSQKRKFLKLSAGSQTKSPLSAGSMPANLNRSVMSSTSSSVKRRTKRKTIILSSFSKRENGMITVRRKKTEEELSRDAQLAEENRKAVEAAETEADAEQLENDETLRISEDALKRAVAFTEVMLVRAYKSFWTEWVSVCDSLSEIENDLAEFFKSLSTGKEDAAYQNDL